MLTRRALLPHPPAQEQKEEQTRRLMQTLDANGDGELSFKEFETWFRETCYRCVHRPHYYHP